MRIGIGKVFDFIEAAKTRDPIVSFFEILSGDSFDVSPEQAVQFFKAKGLSPTFSYADALGKAHAKSFTVAKMMDVDMLGQVRASLDSALANGLPFEQWRKEITPILQAGGWWGKKDVLDPLTGKVEKVQLGSASRLETIFRTNMQSSYAAGQWEMIESQKLIAPYLMYDAVDDFRTRPLHASWDRRIRPVGDDFWKTHYPPNGYNCRCGVIQLSATDLFEMGLEQSPPVPIEYRDWTNPRTGEVVKVPVGVDPGFDVNIGAQGDAKLKQILAEKVAAQEASAKAAAQAAIAAQEAAQAALQAEVKQALLAQAEAAGKAALQRSMLKIEAAVKESAAKTQLEAIATAPKGPGVTFLKNALAKLEKDPGFGFGSAADKLAAVQAEAAALKKKNEIASKLSAYKKHVLDGKTPTPAMVKALNALDEPDKAAFLQKLSDEQAKIAAAKAAAEKAAAEAAAAEMAAKLAAQAPTPVTPAAPVAAVTIPEGTPPNPAKLLRYAAKTKGGTRGEFMQDRDTGAKYLVKYPGSMDAARNEALAGRLYQLAGYEAPELHAITMPNGEPAIASKLLVGFREVDADELQANQSMRESFVVDAWMANWDSVGRDYENTVLIGSRAVKIDVGGSLRYRAIGGLKGGAFGDVVGEIETLRNGTNPAAARVFATVSQAELEAGARRVLSIRDEDIMSVVERFGPEDPAERLALARRMIARKADIAKRFPNAAPKVEAPKAAPVPDSITPEELKTIADSRLNGYALQLDGPDIEAHAVTLHHYIGADRKPRTRAWLKVTQKGAEILKAKTGSAKAGVDIDFGSFKMKLIELLKGVNLRASKGEAFSDRDAQRLDELRSIVSAIKADIARGRVQASNPGTGEEIVELFDSIFDRVVSRLPSGISVGAPAVALPRVEIDELEKLIAFNFAPAGKVAPGLVWRKVENPQFDRVQIEGASAVVKSRGAISGIDLAYETEVDGAALRWLPVTDYGDNGRAAQNIVQIDIEGNDIGTANRALSALKAAGIDTARASLEDRQRYYLNQFASLRLTADRDALRSFVALNDVDAKIEALRKATGVDVRQSRGWLEVNGRREAFGHGRAYTLRPDLDTPAFDAFENTHVVYHNPNGLSSVGSGEISDHVLRIIDGGGQAASQIDRIRRGLFTGSGSSVGSDIRSGGADSFFTRIRKKAEKQGTGFYWKARVLKRMDAITYSGDSFGATGEDELRYRKGQTVESLAAMPNNNSNETVFRSTLSLFDDLEKLVVETKAEKDALIAALKARKYTGWPDGRSFDEVIFTKRGNL